MSNDQQKIVTVQVNFFIPIFKISYLYFFYNLFLKDSTRRVKYVLPVYDGPDPIYPRILLFVNFKDYYYTT